MAGITTRQHKQCMEVKNLLVVAGQTEGAGRVVLDKETRDVGTVVNIVARSALQLVVEQHFIGDGARAGSVPLGDRGIPESAVSGGQGGIINK